MKPPILAALTTMALASIHPRTTLTSTSTPSILIAPPPSPTLSTCDPTPYADCTPYSNSTFSPPTAHFGPTSPATLRVDSGAESAALAALSSVTATWTNGPLYPGLKSVVYEAAPTSIQLSLAVNGYNWDAIVRSDWYTSVPVAWQEVVTRQERALQSVYDNVTGEHLLSSAARLGGGWMVWGLVVVGGIWVGGWLWG
ncbi:uncharacterized protein LY89DRAFT_785927 [Mollisia scopiformis]|uniref:Uncharacterized protein n=1 Tax=Mollisia scopiformis TaxID=149040 RepID=A0A194WXF5_MOLSC|nr:uncharacterized protein LY89DRAFT_785927 [Mollisia scopiformis]KUJ12610.1 hypothetical protein LY89DRAFT_785927 [Mollisia scopiformis]